MTRRNLSMFLNLFSFLAILIIFCYSSPYLATLTAMLRLSFTLPLGLPFTFHRVFLFHGQMVIWAGFFLSVSYLSASICVKKGTSWCACPLPCCDPP